MKEVLHSSSVNFKLFYTSRGYLFTEVKGENNLLGKTFVHIWITLVVLLALGSKHSLAHQVFIKLLLWMSLW